MKLLDSYYDKETGTSYVKIQTEYGNFEGYSFLHPDDMKVESSFLGCEIAEYRATIQYFEKVLSKLNIEINLLENLSYSPEIEKVYKNKKNYKKEIQNNIKSLKDIINNKVENRLLIIDHMNKIKEKKNENEKDSE